MKTYAVINNNSVINLITLNSLQDWHGTETLLEVTGPVNTHHVQIGWEVSNGEFIPPSSLPIENEEEQKLVAENIYMWEQLKKEQEIANYLVKIGILKDNPTAINVTNI